MKMNYYWFNRQEILQKAKEKKDKIKEYQKKKKKKNQELVQYKK